MDKRVLIGATVALVFAAWLVLFTGILDSTPDSADAADVDLVAEGRKVYAAACASCHGARLEGQANWRSPLPDGGRPAPPHDETGHTWHHPDRMLFGMVKDGGQKYSPPRYRNNMPGFAGTLSDREIWASLAYIKSRWPDAIRARQDAIDRRAR